MTLEEITALENKWLKKHPKGGQEALCQQFGIYEAWRKIFEQYVVVARQGELEALKRALFLYWYSRSEPRELCGIPMLDEGLIIEVLGMVNDIVKKGELDTELQWMLPYYYFITDWYLDRLEGFHELKEVSKENTEMWRELCLKSSVSNRGQLGNYWKRLQNRIIN
jgi:hypothetical protein